MLVELDGTQCVSKRPLAYLARLHLAGVFAGRLTADTLSLQFRIHNS
jgi:hypothetical protein